MSTAHRHDVAVIGAGQAGLAAGYFLRRANPDFVILDCGQAPGGAWQHGWDSLHLFSPAEFSTLPGWWMPRQDGREFPTAVGGPRLTRQRKAVTPGARFRAAG